jgi:hypothetical protein
VPSPIGTADPISTLDDTGSCALPPSRRDCRFAPQWLLSSSLTLARSRQSESRWQSLEFPHPSQRADGLDAAKAKVTAVDGIAHSAAFSAVLLGLPGNLGSVAASGSRDVSTSYGFCPEPVAALNATGGRKVGARA